MNEYGKWKGVKFNDYIKELKVFHEFFLKETADLYKIFTFELRIIFV